MGKSELYISVSKNESKITAAESENAAYQAKVDELQSAYDDLKTAKGDLKDLRGNISSLASDTYSSWKGNKFDSIYSNYLSDTLYPSYSAVITEVDGNMATINNKICEYQNKIYSNEGLIGQLKSVINSLWTQIENWID